MASNCGLSTVKFAIQGLKEIKHTANAWLYLGSFGISPFLWDKELKVHFTEIQFPFQAAVHCDITQVFKTDFTLQTPGGPYGCG